MSQQCLQPGTISKASMQGVLSTHYSAFEW